MFVCGWGTGGWRVVRRYARYAYDITQQLPVAAPLARMVDADDAPVASTRAETHTEQADDKKDKASRTKAKADTHRAKHRATRLNHEQQNSGWNESIAHADHKRTPA